MKFCTDIHVFLTMNCKNVVDPLTPHLELSASQNVHLSKTLVLFYQIPAKLFTFPSTPAVVCVSI